MKEWQKLAVELQLTSSLVTSLESITSIQKRVGELPLSQHIPTAENAVTTVPLFKKSDKTPML